MHPHIKGLLFLLLIIFINDTYSQENTIRGIVTHLKIPLQGANILNKQTNRISSTNSSGQYSILATKNDTLVFSFVGMRTIEKKIVTFNSLNISFENDNLLDEVIITALGIEKEKKTTGYATQQLSSEDITIIKRPNITNALSGKISGVNVVNSSGAVGSESRITIRGISSISGNDQPLMIVDGIVIDNISYGDSNDSFGVSTPNGLADLNDDDIESINILKGGTAAALYGMRATNGVILITTKSSKNNNGQLGIEFSSNISIDNIYIVPDYQNEYGQGNSINYFEYIDGINGYGGFDESWGPRLDTGLEFTQWNSADGEVLPWVSQPDNNKNFYNTGVTTDNNIAFTLADENYNARISLGVTNQSGVIPNTDLKKYNISGKFNFNLSSKLSISLHSKYIKSNSENLPSVGYDDTNNQVSQLVWNARNVDFEALRDFENLPTTTVNGSEAPIPTNWNLLYYNNPYWALKNNTNGFERNKIIGGVNFKYTINDKFSLTAQTGIDYFNSLNTKQRAFGTNGFLNGYYEETKRDRQEVNSQAIFKYNDQISNTLKFNFNIGASSMSNKYNRTLTVVPELQINKLYNTTNIRDGAITEIDEDKYNRKINSLFGFTEFSYKDFLFINITGRNDWASVLPISNNNFFYPSVSASLILTDAFNIKSSTLNYLKLRSGWSKTGSVDALEPYSIKPTYEYSIETWNGTPIATFPETLWNPNIKQEETIETEIGIEAKLFKNRLGIDFTYYNKNTYDVIVQKTIDPASGNSFFWDNAADISNKGIELSLNGDIIKNDNGFNLSMNLNFAKNTGEVQNIDNDSTTNDGAVFLGGIWNVSILAKEGEAVGAIYGSAFEKNEDGRVIYENGLPQISDTFEVLGNINPDWTGGLGIDLSYKNLRLTSLFDVKKGGEVYSMTNTWGMYAGALEESAVGRETGVVGDGVIADGNGGYTENNVISDAKIFYKTSYSDLIAESSVFDASFVKWRELSLTYAFSKKILTNSYIKELSISFTARNLAILYKNTPHIDPETSFSNWKGHQGIEYAQIPSTRSFGLGLNIKF